MNTIKKTSKKATTRPRPRADMMDGESAVLAKITAMPEPYRAMGQRLPDNSVSRSIVRYLWLFRANRQSYP